ncbi:MAG TPA: glycosyltransferase family 2 protein [Thermodesulfobacteriaceae bacterium]|nr:glycosyltransferase family 2 protein [Thermodesulfobacteriaceae bacterium]
MDCNKIKLSVIIPCLNAASTLGVQLEALAAQEWSEPWEVIISDNGSTDDSIEIARDFRQRFQSFRIVDASDRRGGPHAINVGVRHAISENLAVCDADDEVQPGWVAAMGQALTQHNIVCGQFKFDKFNEPFLAEQSAMAWKDGLFKGRFLPGGGSGNYGIRKWLHDTIGGFDERLLHAYDADYFWRLQLEGFNLHFLPDAVIQVRIARVNPTFSLLYRRGKNRAASNYWCYKRYRHLGMLPPPPLKKSLSTWLPLLKKMPRVIFQNKKKRHDWLLQFARETGTVVGQIHGRLANPFKPYQPGRLKCSRQMEPGNSH